MIKDQSIFISALKNSETKDSAFKKLIELYKEKIYWHIRKIVLDHDDANDVVQNTFLKIYLNIEKFKENSKIYTWMYRIATNESLNFIKSKSSKIGLSSYDWIDAKASSLFADSYFNGDEASLKLQKEVAKLPEKQRLVFNMKYFDKMKYNQISEILDSTVGSLKASYHHAVTKIKNNLNE